MGDVAGGCQCGAVRYRVTGAQPPVYACHCNECRKQSASGFALSMPVRCARLSIEGKLAVWSRPAASGATTRCHFCPACGTRIYHASSGSPDMVTIKAGSLDEAGALAPVAHLWVSRKQPWIVLDPDVPAFATQPDDLRAWREALMEERP